MPMNDSVANKVLDTIPAVWCKEVSAQLGINENTLASVEIDLDEGFRFVKGLVIITDQRILACLPGEKTWRDWFYQDGLSMSFYEHSGAHYLELFNQHQRLERWNFTSAQKLSSIRVLEQFEEQQLYHRTGQRLDNSYYSYCLNCNNRIELNSNQCPICTEQVAQPLPIRSLFNLWVFAKPYRKQLLGGFILTLLSTSASLIPPYLTMPLMDNVLIPYQSGQHTQSRLVVFYLICIFGAYLLTWILNWSKTYVIDTVSQRISTDVRTTAYQHLLTLSLSYFAEKRTGELISRIGRESDRISVFLSVHLIDFVTDIIMMLMTVPILFYIDYTLALVTLIPLPLVVLLIHQMRLRIRHNTQKIDKVWWKLANALSETIPGIRVVKSFVQEKKEAARFNVINQRHLKANVELNKFSSLFYPTISLFTDIGVLIVWAFGIWQIANGRIKVGVLIAFVAYISRFYGQISSFSRLITASQTASVATKQIFDIIDEQPSVPEPKEPISIKQLKGDIDIRNVSFSYGKNKVSNNINLKINSGEMLGLVGYSGAGKSTLAHLICRFSDVTEGSIYVDGVDIRSYALDEYRSHIGFVPQEALLFFGTIAENIAYGKPDATKEEIIDAARAAHAHNFIVRLQHGYDTVIGERGQKLSGGERQRISIARAVLINPRILILDEATSSVDSKTEYAIQKALENLTRGRTTIAIAHRLSTLQRADRIVVLDAGQIVEEGNHNDLMAKEGAYFSFYKEQVRNNTIDNQVGV